jgi:hypothetical protein
MSKTAVRLVFLIKLYNAADATLTWTNGGTSALMMDSSFAAMRKHAGARAAFFQSKAQQWVQVWEGWNQASEYCKSDGQRLCRVDEICKNGEGSAPVGGTVKGDWFSPVVEKKGKYVYVGDAFADRLCKTFEPGWDETSETNLVKTKCCGDVDEAARAEFLQAKKAALPPPRVYKPGVDGALEPKYLHDYQSVLNHLQYWNRRKLTSEDFAKIDSLFQKKSNRFLGQELDMGGFNNVREAFEHMVIHALVSGRRLLIPPRSLMYFPEGGPGKIPDSLVQVGYMLEYDVTSTKHLSDFIDLDDMCGDGSPLACATPTEFVEAQSSAEVATSLADIAMQLEIFGYRETASAWEDNSITYGDWVKKLRNMSTVPPPITDALKMYLCFPSIDEVMKERPPSASFLAGEREAAEMTAQQKEAQLLHYPVSHDQRFLGQIAASVAFNDPDLERLMHRFFHDRVHYRPESFALAARVVAQLGLFQYSSVHLRRGDLQYTQVFIPLETVGRNIRGLLQDNEPMYISTDDPEDLQQISEGSGGRPIWRWTDFFTERGGNVLKDQNIDDKVVGQVEQIIAACGRVFVGTRYSTFSAYIPRLRGYLGAPDTQRYFNTQRYFGPLEKKYPVDGSEYMVEFPAMWEDV